MINNRMMLCSVFGGDINDYQNMIFVISGINYVACPHNDVIAYIDLKSIVFDSKYIGKVGQCEICKKIYYNT